MKRIRCPGHLCVVLLLSLSRIAQAQEAQPPGRLERLLAARPTLNQSLTIEEAVAIALKESPVIRGAVAEVEAAEGKVRSALSQKRPSVSAHTFLSGGSNANIASSPGPVMPSMLMALPRDTFADQNISVMYPLFTGGRLSALVRQASSLRNASDAEREMQRQEVALLTRTAYREVVGRRALVTVQEARLAENEERLRLDKIRLEQERIPAYYVRRDEAEVAAAKQELTNAQRDADLALVQLKTLMGVNPASQISIMSPAEPDTMTAADEIARLTGNGSGLPALLRVAEAHRPELAASRERVRGAESGVAAVQGSYRPQVSLFGMGDAMKMRGQKALAGITYGVVASIPLYNGGQKRADLQAATAERKKAETEEERVALQVAQEVQAALLNIQAAEQNIKTAAIALAAVQEEYQAAKARYEAGRSIITEMLDVQASRVRAQANLVQARLQFGQALDQLKRAVGFVDI